VSGVAGQAPSLARFGLAVGHASDPIGGTGCTVVRGISTPHRAAGVVIGRATGSRELALLEPGHLVERVDAILLTGGSAYGLDAAAGVMRWMEERGRGFPVGAGVVPIVPAAVIFDLAPLGRFDARPTPQMAYDACESASSEGIAEGSVGAGTGATVGKLRGPAGAMKGGLGLAVVEEAGSAAMAIAVVNASRARGNLTAHSWTPYAPSPKVRRPAASWPGRRPR
jgi:L-aminopeptidase/D-esterase-like protein